MRFLRICVFDGSNPVTCRRNEASATWHRVVQRCSLKGIFSSNVVYKVQLSIQCRALTRAVPFGCPTYLHASIVCLHTRKSLYTGTSRWHIARGMGRIQWPDRSRITCRREITCSDFTVRASACVTLHEVSYIMFYLAVYITMTHEISTCAGKVANFQASLSPLHRLLPSVNSMYIFQDENRLYINIWILEASTQSTCRRDITPLWYGSVP